jgi:hypothetical protein
MPCTFATADWRRRMTADAEMRLASGFRLIWIRPLLSVVLVPSTPMNEDRLYTAGSSMMTDTSFCCCRAISANETLWSASETPWISPVSWTGKNPLGITT